MPFLICCKTMGGGVVPCTLLHLLTCAFASPALVLAPHPAGYHLEGLEWKEPSIWEGLQPLSLGQLSVFLFFVHWAAALGNGLVTSGVSMWQHWDCQFRPCSFSLKNLFSHNLVCGELTLHRGLADGNWMWINLKLSPLTVLREGPKC